ncbi:MAG TPA: DUF2784 domain-containing protein [Tenuifilaceae bacterium]|nr:DUF2784 domain-containing protein [Tenuifilaceae bacterium]HPE18848.1 DUF2784 domain-containing protein [Tenuifilaceae bacterium]HPJ46884.1 DUF2784 domain-containing protein [Tenuifilaceae bacterium]HPQ35131.1 DUF2784 domain-containing protein [Tenuifilaceae bacterium]
MIYGILDWFFTVFHSLLILFNLFGWIWKPLRKANLILLMLTGGSWTILGIFFGLGYCPLTDWHWNVLEILGKEPNTSSYVAYLLQRVLSITLSDNSANAITTITYITALATSIIFNLKKYRRVTR